MNTVVLISAGSGPVEVGEFVGKLADLFEQALLPWIVSKQVQGLAVAPRSVALTLAAAELSAISPLQGTHALVSRSSLRTRKGRKRWFASVQLFPIDAARGECDIRPSDLRMSACRSGGPGGQNVNKRSSAVRLIHVPSGRSVRVSDQRTQSANRRIATARLTELIAKERAGQRQNQTAAVRGAHYRLVRGNPVCTYRLDGNNRLRLIAGPGLSLLRSVP